MSGIARFFIWVITVLIATFLIYWLWNNVLVNAVAFFRPITFWGALGIAILVRLLFGPSLLHERYIMESLPKEWQVTSVERTPTGRTRTTRRRVTRSA
jgi:hypothetical protein